MKSLNAICITLLLSITNMANAGIIKTFVFDDISMWSSSSNLAVNDSLSIEFNTLTDFDNVQTSDVLGFQYNLIAGDTEWYSTADYTTVQVYNQGFSDVFEISGSEVLMKYNISTIGYIQASKNGLFGQIAPGQATHMVAQYLNASGDMAMMTANGYTREVSYSTASAQDVPEPSTLAIFALGMIGLASRRFKKQS